MGLIDGGNVLITGASDGLGKELAKQLARRAKTLVLLAKNRDKLEEVHRDLKSRNEKLEVIVEPCDLSNLQDVDRVINSILSKVQIDVLINNAGVGDFSLFDCSRWENDMQILQVNVIGLTFLTHKLLPPMVKRMKGGIMNISSGVVDITIPCAAVYNGSKHYVNGFCETLNMDLTGTNVHVTQVLPGPVSTDIGKQQLGSLSVAGFIAISPEQCAKEAIKGFDNRATKVYPGFMYRWAMYLYSFIPNLVVVSFGKAAAWSLRREERRQFLMGKSD